MKATLPSLMKLKIAKDFSTAPGPRKISEGKFSGELFRKEKLLPAVHEAVEKGEQLVVSLDGTSGYGTSFLEESFGGLIRENGFTLSQLKSALCIVSEEEPELLEEINEYMEKAEVERRGMK